MSLWPIMLRVTGLHTYPALARGFALGAVSHVSAVAALTAAGELAAADAAALSFFLMGTTRGKPRIDWLRMHAAPACRCLGTPPVKTRLMVAAASRRRRRRFTTTTAGS